MSNGVAAALNEHNHAASDRKQAQTRMGARWRDAAARVVEARFLEPLDLGDRSFAAALSDLAQQLDQAERLLG